MNTRNHYGAHGILAASLLAFSQCAWSLGLGEARVESFLGQPLEVNIELITRPSDDLASVAASLASADDYELIGASRDDISVPLQFTVMGLDGEQGDKVYIAVSSKLSLSNPVVRLILEVNWSKGRMLREYTLFLDPPTFSQPAPAPRIKDERKPETQTTTAPRVEAERPPEAQPSQPRAQKVSPAAGDSRATGTEEYGPVQSGDTLWRIAKNWSAGTDLNLNKVMLAIQRQNPQAFSRNNINLLQRGAILRMPAREDVNSITSASATSEVRQQSEAFRSGRDVNMASPAVPLLAEESVVAEPAPDTQAEAQADEQASRVEEPVSEPLAANELPTAESPVDSAPGQLELLPPSDDGSLGNTSGVEEAQSGMDEVVSAQVLREELSRKEEELINQQQQNAYLEQRLQELETQLTQSREGIVEDDNLAGMEDRLREERLSEQKKDIPKVVSLPDDEISWYKRFPLWLLGLLVLVAGIAGWLMSRRGSSDTSVSDLGRDPAPASGSSDKVQEKAIQEDETQVEPVQEVTPEAAETSASEESEETVIAPVRKKSTEDEDVAQILDEESADPEIQLDLARAYISMGDKEAARVILEEVVANGSQEQQAEANKMKDML